SSTACPRTPARRFRARCCTASSRPCGTRRRTACTCRRRCSCCSLAEPPVRSFRTKAAWEKWLDAHHEDEAGIWMKFAKKGMGATTVTYAEALEVALCYGWIDAQVKRFDETYYLQRFTPRRARSKWSKINRDAATGLTEAGAMRPPGLAAVERAKADGRWDAACDSPANATLPEDFERALAHNK